jgi:hypothetical protein
MDTGIGFFRSSNMVATICTLDTKIWELTSGSEEAFFTLSEACQIRQGTQALRSTAQCCHCDEIPRSVLADNQTATERVFLTADKEWPIRNENNRRSERTKNGMTVDSKY